MRPHASGKALSITVLICGLVVPLASYAPAAENTPDTTPAAESGRSLLRSSSDLETELRALEQKHHAQIGLDMIDTRTGERRSYRSDERFGYASTLKALLAALFLREFSPEQRNEHVTWTQEEVDTAGYSPITSTHVADGLTLIELAEATVRTSDNTAFNIVAKRLGGVSGLQSKIRDLGDTTTEIRDLEPDLNRGAEGRADNTTTAAAFTDLLSRIVSGNALAPSDRDLLVSWMSGNATGDALIRAGVPKTWTVADKSGGAGPLRNDIAVIDSGTGAPIIVSILTRKTDPDAGYEDALVAEAAKILFPDADGRNTP